jgi:hypothetical protein
MKLIKLFEQFISEEVELYQVGNASTQYLDKDFKPLGQASSCRINSVYTAEPASGADGHHGEGLNITIGALTFDVDFYTPDSPMRPQPGVFDLYTQTIPYFARPEGTRYIKIYKKGEAPQVG